VERGGLPPLCETAISAGAVPRAKQSSPGKSGSKLPHSKDPAETPECFNKFLNRGARLSGARAAAPPGIAPKKDCRDVSFRFAAHASCQLGTID